MTLDRRHTLALIGATLTSAIALGDAVTHGLTGQSSVFAGDSGATAWSEIGGLVHGLTYAALGWVLVGERDRFATANRFARVLRLVLIPTFDVMAVAFVMGGAFGKITSAFIDGMVMPVVGQLTGGVDFNNKKWVLTKAAAEVKDASGAVTTPAVAEVAVKWGPSSR